MDIEKNESAVDGQAIGFHPVNLSITFSLDSNKECGKLFMKDGLLTFEGNVDESAAILFKHVTDTFNDT